MTTLPDDATGRRSIYTGRTTSWPMVAGTSVGAAVIVVMMVQQPGSGWSAVAVPLALVALGVLANVLTASSVRATAGPNGFTVHWGVIGWPRCHYRPEEIERAEVIDLSWWKVSWGFWWTPKRTSCTVASGPTVRLTLRNGRLVTITVPQPEVAVDVITRALDDR